MVAENNTLRRSVPVSRPIERASPILEAPIHSIFNKGRNLSSVAAIVKNRVNMKLQNSPLAVENPTLTSALEKTKKFSILFAGDLREKTIYFSNNFRGSATATCAAAEPEINSVINFGHTSVAMAALAMAQSLPSTSTKVILLGGLGKYFVDVNKRKILRSTGVLYQRIQILEQLLCEVANQTDSNTKIVLMGPYPLLDQQFTESLMVHSNELFYALSNSTNKQTKQILPRCAFFNTAKVILNLTQAWTKSLQEEAKLNPNQAKIEAQRRIYKLKSTTSGPATLDRLSDVATGILGEVLLNSLITDINRNRHQANDETWNRLAATHQGELSSDLLPNHNSIDSCNSRVMEEEVSGIGENSQNDAQLQMPLSMPTTMPSPNEGYFHRNNYNSNNARTYQQRGRGNQNRRGHQNPHKRSYNKPHYSNGPQQKRTRF